jgi:hypothetical protein
MKVTTVIEVERTITRAVSIGDGRTDEDEVGTRLVEVTVEADVVEDADQHRVIDPTVMHPKGLAWRDLEHSEQLDAEGSLIGAYQAQLHAVRRARLELESSLAELRTAWDAQRYVGGSLPSGPVGHWIARTLKAHEALRSVEKAP